MHDQANQLRRLVRRYGRQETSALCPRFNLIVVAGGKGGVGTTSVAVNLAVATAGLGLRTVLVDADLYGGDTALLCGLEPRGSIADVLAGRRTIHEVLQPGPGAIQVLPGVWGSPGVPDDAAAAGRRLVAELQTLDPHADLVLLDGGTSPNRVIRQCWSLADLVLLVSTPETASIINTYALIKTLVEEAPAVTIHVLVNLVSAAGAAEEVRRRLTEASRRFLATQLHWAGYLPADPQVAAAAAAGRPFVTAVPASAAAGELCRLAGALAAVLAGGDRADCVPTHIDTCPRKTPAANPADSLNPGDHAIPDNRQKRFNPLPSPVR